MIENLFYIIVALLFFLVIVFRDRIKRIIFSPTGGFEVELREEEDDDEKSLPPDVEPKSEKQEKEKPSVSPFLTGEIDFDETDLEPEFMSDDYLVMLSSRLELYAKPGDSVKFVDKTSHPSEEEDDEFKLPNSDE